MELRLKQIREAKGVSQKEMTCRLSSLMGKEIKVRTYGSWERQEVDMDLEQAYNCAIALGCTLNDLVGMKAPNHPAFSDPRQEQLNGYYECMNEAGRQLAVDSIRAMSSSVELRVEKSRAEGFADQAAMGA